MPIRGPGARQIGSEQTSAPIPGIRHQTSSGPLSRQNPERRKSYDGGVKVSTRGDYASRALLSLALHQQEGPTSVRDIAERTALPQPYLEQILLALKGAGLVRSKRGVGGGYTLARPPEDIDLAQIVSAVDGPIQAGDFGEPHTDGACDHEGQCVLLAIWNSAGDAMRDLLANFTLADLSEMTSGTQPWPGDS
jgi:Rrf2 family iron-sulfur cluster assembly transcriptional regulator